jgi:uncharacterized protein YjbI with pentapeptide repeats
VDGHKCDTPLDPKLALLLHPILALSRHHAPPPNRYLAALQLSRMRSRALTGCQMTGVQMTGVQMTGVQMTGAQMTGAS